MSDPLGEFSNNLASDLGPLLALFGESMTIQYLSECTTIEDYIIFATAPIGIITALVSAIRICGGTYLRAFVGRAQEGAAAAEVELCTSTGRDVCELFTRGGITRSLGKPSILELVYLQPEPGSSSHPAQDPKNLQIYRKYLKRHGGGRWPRKSRDTKIRQHKGPEHWLKKAQSHLKDPEEGDLLKPEEKEATDPEPDTDLPNLSLNVGIVKPPRYVFWVVAAIGVVLQTGVLVLAALDPAGSLDQEPSPTEDTTPDSALVRDSLLFIIGTLLMCLGMGACAALIGRTTREFVDTKREPERERLLWLQPGNQKIGDQSFDCYAIFETRRLPVTRYMISTMDDRRREKMHLHTTIVAATTLVGFIAQFIGIRGLNAWVSLAQLIITIVMSLLRGIVRMQRRGKEDNELKPYDHGVHGHELDWLAFNLACDDCSKHRYSHDSGDSSSEPQLHRGYSFQVTGETLVLPLDEEEAVDAERTGPSEKLGKPEDQNGSIVPSETSAEKKASGVSVKARDLYMTERSRQCHAAPDPKAVFEMRVRLANLTGNIPASILQKGLMDGQYQNWDSQLVSCREKACQISKAVCDAAAALFLDASQRKSLQLTVGVSKLEVGAKAHQTVTVQLEAPVGSTSTAWTIDTAAVEALLGLWVWSITEPISRTPASHRSTGSDEVRRPSNSARIVATGDGDEHWGRRTNVETELWMLLGSDTPTLKTAKVRVAAQSEYGIVNMWPLHDSSSKEGGEIWQHTPPPGVHPSQGRALFGWQRADSSAREPGADNRTYTIQYVDVTTPILNICAQEIYTSLIASIASSASFAGLDLTFSGKGADRRLVSDRFSAIRDSFVEQSLGTTSDAVLCLLSAFRTKLQINPTQEDVLEIVMECLTTTDWKAMELFLRWAVIVFEGDDLKRIIRATAEFYRRAMVQQRQVDFCSEGIRWLASKVPNSFLGEDGIIRGHEAVIRRVKERGFPEFTPQELLAATGLTYDHSNRNFDRVPDDDDDDAKCNRMLTALYLLCGTPMLATEAREQMDDDEKRFLIRALGRSFENSAASPATLWSSIALSITWAFSKAPLSYFFNDSYFRDAISGVPTSDISPVGNAVLLDDHDLAYLLRRLGAYSRLENGLENGLASRWFGDEDAVSQAARKGSLRMIHLLLPCGTPVEKEIFAFQQLLLSSARTGNLPDLKYAVAGLQRRDGKIDVRDGDSQTALSIAARRGDAASVEYLLSLGNGVVDPCSRDNTRTTPLSWALKGSSPIYDLDTNLLYCSSAWRQSQHKTGSFHRVQYKEDILYAMPKDFDAVLKALINTAHFSRREKLWVADSEGRTPVSLAALTGSAKLTEEICEAFRTAVATGVVDDDQADSSHRTPLSLAAKAGHAEVVKYLLSRRSCRPNMADLRGHTALHLAASSDTGEAALEVLLESRRVDPNIKDMEGRTPLCLAAQQARPASVKALLKRKDVDISMADHVGRTPLSHAAEGPLGSMVAASWQAARRLRKTVAVLMEHCSEEDLNAEDVDGLTPLFWAIKGGNLPAINLLVRDERVWLPGPGDEDWDGRQLVDVASKKTLDFLLRLGVWKTWEEEGEDGAPYWAVVEEPEIAPPEAVAEYLEEESDADEASSAGEEGVDADPEDAHSSEGSAGTGPREQNPTMGDTEETGEEENTAPDTEGIEGPEHVLGAEREDDEEQKNTAAGDKGAKGHDQESVAEKTAGEEVKRNEEGG